MRKAELTHWLRSDKVFDLKHVDCALETVVEENVRKFLLTRLQLLIANYPTTLKVKVKSDGCAICLYSAFHIDRSRSKSTRIFSSFFFLQEDLELLETSLPQMKKMTVQLRVTEKKILSGALDYVEQWIKA